MVLFNKNIYDFESFLYLKITNHIYLNERKPFTAKTTWFSKTRIKSNVIDWKSWKDSSMRLASREIIRVGSKQVKSIESDKIFWIFFCQIIVGSPLNSNVPEGRRVAIKMSSICLTPSIGDSRDTELCSSVTIFFSSSNATMLARQRCKQVILT